jgi:hypothetical protein
LKNKLSGRPTVLLATLVTFTAVVLIANPFVVKTESSNSPQLPGAFHQSSKISSSSVTISIRSSSAITTVHYSLAEISRSVGSNGELGETNLSRPIP